MEIPNFIWLFDRQFVEVSKVLWYFLFNLQDLQNQYSWGFQAKWVKTWQTLTFHHTYYHILYAILIIQSLFIGPPCENMESCIREGQGPVASPPPPPI
jgi:hypothetical protein